MVLEPKTMLAEICEKHKVPLPLLQGLMRIEATPPRRGRQGVVNRSRELVERYARNEQERTETHDVGGMVPIQAGAAPSLSLTEISLENFCLFQQAKAEFRQDTEKPICIIEAQNGHGKSTFLRAVRFALYGTSRSQLHSYLHHYVEPPTARMQVVLRLETHRGPTVIKRGVNFGATSSGWEASGASELTISIGIGETAETLHESDAEEWIEMYLPKDVMDFFCFDAENSLVNEMAQGASSKLIARALESVLGVTTIRTISERCQRLKREWEKEQEDSTTILTPKQAKAQVAEVEAEQDSVKRKLESLHREREQLQDEHERLSQRIEEVLAHFDPAAEAERQLFRESLLEVDRKLREWEENQEHLVGFLLPLQLLDEVLSGAIEEAQIQKAFELSEERVKGLHSALQAVAKLAVKGKIPWVEHPMPSEEAILERLTLEVHAPESQDALAGPALTEREMIAIERLLQQAHESVPIAELVDMARQLRSQKVELEKKAPAQKGSDMHQELIQEHKLLLARKEDFVSRLAVVEEKIANFALRKEELRREKQETDSELKAARQAERRLKARKSKIQLAKRAAKALEDFTIQLRGLRVDTLEKQASELFHRITNKPELYSTISFDRKTLQYQLLDHDGKPVPLRRSTGEKAVLAMAVVHGLQKASGRSLPLIVEAPLKPLDPVHTTGLLTHFFANHTGQSILLLKPSELSAAMAPTVAPRIGQKIVLKRPEPEKDISVLVEQESLV